MIQDVDFITETKKGTLIKVKATLEFDGKRIYFLKSPFSLKDEIKAMKGSKWHGFLEDDGRKIWSVEDCPRNRFQLAYLQGEDVYAWYDRDLIEHEFRQYFFKGQPADPMPHQFHMANHMLTYHYVVEAAEMGTGKTLAAQMCMEHSGNKEWWWVGPKTSLPNIQREFRYWDIDPTLNIQFMTYDAVVSWRDNYKGGPVPRGVIADEASRVKGATSQRTNAFQFLADKIREQYGNDGFVVGMSGTPAPKSPMDWWSLCEIVCPGFLKEGSPKALENRLAFFVKKTYDSGTFNQRIGWKDDERKCASCGEFEHNHDVADDCPEYTPSKNEVAYMYERLKGPVLVKRLRDCVNLPDKRYRRVICKPSSSLLRAAKAITDVAPNAITAATQLRELSDGFMYRDKKEGMMACSHCNDGKVFEWEGDGDGKTYRAIDLLDPEIAKTLKRVEVACPQCNGTCEVPRIVRETKLLPCPKEKALTIDLGRCEETGRIVIFAGFTGSIEKIVEVCRREGWATVECHSGAWDVKDAMGNPVTSDGGKALDYWSNRENARVAFIAHPASGGQSLTLTESRMVVFYSNTFKPEDRIQAEGRCHRKGMDENIGCEIVDYCHLPSDQRVLDVVLDNRRVELMTLGDLIAEETTTNVDCVIEELAV